MFYFTQQLICFLVFVKQNFRKYPGARLIYLSIDWRRKQSDFYRLTFDNLTNYPIALVSRKFHQKYSQPMKWQTKSANGKILEYNTTKNPTFVDFSQVRYGGNNVLLPKEKRIQSNWFYHTNEEMPYNVLILVYTIDYLGKEYSFNAYMIYQR